MHDANDFDGCPFSRDPQGSAGNILHGILAALSCGSRLNEAAPLQFRQADSDFQTEFCDVNCPHTSSTLS